MITIAKITFQDIRDAVMDSDLHRAIRALQDKAGIRDGGIASMHIEEDRWGAGTLAENELMVAQWLVAEDFHMNHRTHRLACPAMTIVTAAARNVIVNAGRLPIITL